MKYGIKDILSLVSKIHTQSADFIQKEMTEMGLENFSSSHGNILYSLSKTEEMQMGELSEKINRDKSTTTVLVRKLEKIGLVKIEKAESDSRKKIITLTEKGKAFNEKTSKLSEKLIFGCYRGFSEEEKVMLLSFLNRISENLCS